jgi:hypothetical protein
MALTLVMGASATGSAQSRAENATGDAVTVVACVVRESDYARSTTTGPTEGAATQLLLANAQTGLPSHSLTGLRESELSAQLGKRIEVTGTVERARTTPVLATADGTRTGQVTSEAPGATGVTHEGAAAHEPADALSSTVRAGKVAEPSARVADPSYRAATLPRLNATAFKPVSGSCAMPTPNAAASAPTSPVAAQSTSARPSSAVATLESITARGCLVRQTGNGTALTADRDQRDPLVLANAVLVSSEASASRSGVSGSAASASGSGTVPDATGTSGRAAVDAATMSFALETPAAELPKLAEHVGERVEISGTLRIAEAPARAEPAPAAAPAARTAEAGRGQPAPDVAHPSAPARSITVTAFRLVGGSCN